VVTRPTPSTVGPGGELVETFELEPVSDEAAEHLKEVVSTLLSAGAMVAVAGGVGWGLWPWLGPFAVAVGGLLLTVFVVIADAGRRPRPETVERSRSYRDSPVPGPSAPGKLHAKGPGATP